MAQRGADPADWAAALSGVPISTVHWWARRDVPVPSISAHRIKLWSYPDLTGLRLIYWLRQVKEAPNDAVVPQTAMPAVRRAIGQLAELASLGASAVVRRSSLFHTSSAYGSGFEDMERRVPDTTKLRTLTGWERPRSLDAVLAGVMTEAAVGAVRFLSSVLVADVAARCL